MQFGSTLNRACCFVSPIVPKYLASSFCGKVMAAKSGVSSRSISLDPAEAEICYPKPLSPPLPSISKEVELERALEASSRSSIFSLKMEDVLYEDEWLIAVNKPKGIYCESLLNSVHGVVHKRTDKIGINEVTLRGELELHLANRLDRDTSGVMLITKSHKVASKLVKAFTNHEIHKSYVALCIGAVPEWKRITVKSGHGRSKYGVWRVYALSDVGRVLPGGSVVRNMETTFELLSINGEENIEGLSESKKREANTLLVEEEAKIGNDARIEEILVRAFPRSGRTHQIRLHSQHLGIPIRGDVKYNGMLDWKGRTYDGHDLHAESLSFSHPVTGLNVMVRAPLPFWASEYVKP